MKFFKKHKRGIELSVNFLVMMILGIAMLGGAMVMTSKLFGKAKDYQKTVDAQTQKEIRKLITDSNELVVIYPARKNIGRKDSDSFGIGIQNILKTQSAKDSFTMGVTFDKAFNKDRRELCSSSNLPGKCKTPTPDKWINYVKAAQSVKKNELKIFNARVEVPKGAPSGIYIFDVRVCGPPGQFSPPKSCNPSDPLVPDENLYDGIKHKIYVGVE